MNKEELKQSFCGQMPLISPTSRNHSLDLIFSLTTGDGNKYKEARRNARRSVALAQEKTRQELVNELESTAGKKKCLQGCKANGKIQAACSRSKLCERWQNPGRM